MRQYINLFEAKDVDGDVDMLKQNLTAIPEEYGIVTGYFWCQNNRLTTLKGSPREVGKNFWCYGNKLTTLKGGPKKVGWQFSCHNNQLLTLEGGPKEVGGYYWCHENQLSTLKGAPEKVKQDFDCQDNPNLTPWEMRYILFTKLGGEFNSDYKKANNVVNEFMQLSQKEKQDQIQDYMARLREIK